MDRKYRNVGVGCWNGRGDGRRASSSRAATRRDRAAPHPMAPAADGTVLSSDFEDGEVAPWQPRGPAALEVTSEVAHQGENALLVSGRTDDWNGPATDALALLTPRQEHTITAWVRLAPGISGGGDTPLH